MCSCIQCVWGRDNGILYGNWTAIDLNAAVLYQLKRRLLERVQGMCLLLHSFVKRVFIPLFLTV